MAILLLMPGRDCSDLLRALKEKDPDLDVRIWPETGDKQDIDYIIVWNHPAGALTAYPNLKVIASLGAGVDHIFADPDIPKLAVITRLVNDSLARQMSEYISGVILNRRLRLTDYREYQAATAWRQQAARPGDIVCLLGMGRLGQAAARYLTGLGFTVHGWSRTPKDNGLCKNFQGEAGLAEALADADYIVCLLPLTPQTENILDSSLFRLAKKGAYLINVGRGGHLNEADLLDALYREQLGGACLDVFTTEPLPSDHPFWRHPKIYITPHSASLTLMDQAALKFYQNYLNMKNGRPLFNIVDQAQGY